MNWKNHSKLKHLHAHSVECQRNKWTLYRYHHHNLEYLSFGIIIYKFYFNGTKSINKWAKYMFLTALTTISLSFILILYNVHSILYIDHHCTTRNIFISITSINKFFHWLTILHINKENIFSYFKYYFNIINWNNLCYIRLFMVISNWYFHTFSFILFIIGNSHLAYCFNHNLFLLVLSQRSTVIQTDTNKDHSDLNIRQKKMLQIVVKQTLLSCMVLVIHLLSVIFIIITVSIYSKMVKSIISITDMYIGQSVYVQYMMLCQYLIIFNVKCYNKICSKCHIKCDHFCQYLTAKRMNVWWRYVFYLSF